MARGSRAGRPAGPGGWGALRIGDPIALTGVDGTSHASRIEGLDDGTVTVAAPGSIPAAGAPRPGATFTLEAAAASGVIEAAVEFAAARTSGRVRLWDLTRNGEVSLRQRRQHVRIAASGPFTVRTLTPNAETAPETTGRLCDVSEAAARCLIPAAVGDAAAPPDGTPVECSFTLHGERFDVPGRVLRALPPEPGGRQPVVIAFEAVPAVTDRLRSRIFAAQIEARRNSR